jgi:hypothetical protein
MTRIELKLEMGSMFRVITHGANVISRLGRGSVAMVTHAMGM